jgi:hypothetical protein
MKIKNKKHTDKTQEEIRGTGPECFVLQHRTLEFNT